MPPSPDLPLCIAGDVHLGRGAHAEAAADLATLIRAHAGHELILNGDTFDLSVDRPEAAPEASVVQLLRRHEAVRSALREHLVAGYAATLVAGNHDAAIVLPAVRPALLGALELGQDAPLAVAPWFLRRGAVHIEHGHVYDPDNAPTHPLAPWTAETEPLGVALTRRFVAPTAGWAFAHGDETTPFAGLLRAFRLYGLRAPSMVARYYLTAAELVREAGRQPGLAEEKLGGARRVDQTAPELGLDADTLHQLAALRANPTHHHRGATFERLYLDRSAAFVALLGATGGALAGSVAGAGLAALTASYLGWSIARGVNRYGGLLERRLADSAARIREVTGAALVVLGHAHRECSAPGYLNPGAFAFPQAAARRFVQVERDGTAELRTLGG